jgi:GH25 family lysozyme M1 (1,4-beta-N-acetylmuramidase)
MYLPGAPYGAGSVEPLPEYMDVGVPGIDISKWQGWVDFLEAHDQGIRFVIAKCSEGNAYYDPTFERNYLGAKAVGMVVGAYHYVRPGVKINYQINTINKALGTREIDAFMLDCESTDGRTPQEITDVIWGLAGKFGQRAPVMLNYTAKYWWNPNVKRSTHWKEVAGLAVANWHVATPAMPADWDLWTVWQQGIVSARFGVAGQVDYDVWNPNVPFPGDATPPPPPERKAKIKLTGYKTAELEKE